METDSTTSRETLINEALRRLERIDFQGVRLKLADPIEGLGWPEDTIDEAESRYRQFLALTHAYPDRTIVPTTFVDVFWHQHILDTRAYAADTVAVFGFFLHHFPYLGMRGKADQEQLARSFEDSNELWALHFGGATALAGVGSSCSGGSNCSRCSSAD